MFYCTVHYNTKGEKHFVSWKFICCNYARKLALAFDSNNSTYSEMKQVSEWKQTSQSDYKRSFSKMVII
jgi:hypothetical protein